MKFLLLLLATSFFFIFFMFSKLSFLGESVFQNLYLEAQIYIALGVFLAFYIFKKEKIRDVKVEIMERQEKIHTPKREVFVYIKQFFENYIYYVACILFYTAFFIIFKAIFGEIHIPRLFLFFNILVVLLHVFENKFRVFQDFVRVNTIVISAYYVFFHILYLFGYAQNFLWEDFINITLLLLLFIFFFRSSQSKKYIPIIASYMLLFVFLEICVIVKYFQGNIIMSIEILSFTLAAVFMIFTDNFSKYFQISKLLLRIWAVVLSYIFIIFSIIYIQETSIESVFIFSGVVYSSYILYMFHKRFENYITLFFASIAIFMAFIYIYARILPDALEYTYSSFLFFVLSVLWLFFDIIKKKKYIYDTYFFHIFSILVNVYGVFLFFFFRDFSILEFGILLLGESLYFFFSYYTLHNISQRG